MLDEEEPFFKVLEAEWREVFAVEDVFEADVEDGSEAPTSDLAYCWWWVAEAVLGR